MTSPTVYHWLLNGLAMYQKVPDHAELASKQRLLLWFPYGQYHVVVHEDSGIRTLQDLKGKKVFLGPPGGGAWSAARGWVKAVTGLDPEEGDFENVKASWSSAFQGFQDRHFDVYVNGGIAPFPQVEQLSLTSEIRLIGLDQAGYEASQSAKDYLRALNGRELGIIEQGVYGDKVRMDHDIYTLGAAVGIMARADMDDDQVYAITKAFWDNIDEARASTPWLGAITLDYAVHEGGMPLHPGALRYYEETGVPIPEGSKP
jgi:TRAP transporter TAXI family solute receptor